MNDGLSPKENKVVMIITGIISAFIVIIVVGGFYWLTTPEDHGEVVEMKAWWNGIGLYDDYTIEPDDRWVLCQVTYEDGCKEYVHDWTIEKPVTLHKNKKNKFTVLYGDFKYKVVVGPEEESRQNNQTVHLTREMQNAALAEEIIVGYPGHDHQWYLDQLNNEGLSYSEAEAALQVAGY